MAVCNGCASVCQALSKESLSDIISFCAMNYDVIIFAGPPDVLMARPPPHVAAAKRTLLFLDKTYPNSLLQKQIHRMFTKINMRGLRSTFFLVVPKDLISLAAVE